MKILNKKIIWALAINILYAFYLTWVSNFNLSWEFVVFFAGFGLVSAAVIFLVSKYFPNLGA